MVEGVRVRSFRHVHESCLVNLISSCRCLILLDRDLSTTLGRSPAFHDEEYADLNSPALMMLSKLQFPRTDIDFSYDIGEETVDLPGCTFASHALHLSGLVALLLRSIYATRKPRFLKCKGVDFEVRMVPVLVTAAHRWRVSLPDHRQHFSPVPPTFCISTDVENT